MYHSWGSQNAWLRQIHGENRLHMAVLNNFAYSEFVSGAHQRAQAVAERLRRMADRYGFDLDPADLDTIGCIQIENGLFREQHRGKCDDGFARSGLSGHDQVAFPGVVLEDRGLDGRGLDVSPFDEGLGNRQGKQWKCHDIRSCRAAFYSGLGIIRRKVREPIQSIGPIATIGSTFSSRTRERIKVTQGTNRAHDGETGTTGLPLWFGFERC